MFARILRTNTRPPRRMIDWMAEDGVGDGFNGSQAREVIMTIDQWEESRAAMR